MSYYTSYPYAAPQYFPQPIPRQTSGVKNAALVGAVMGAAGATAGPPHAIHARAPGVIGDILVGAVTGGLATAGVVAVGESIGLKHSVSSTAVMFVTATALLYAMQNR